MPRPEKVQAVAEIKERFEAAQAVFLTEYRGIAVEQMGDLRRRVRAAGGDYKVVKMTLARRAAEGLGLEGLTGEMAGPTALAFANADPVGVAKALHDYAKENDRLVIKLGLLADKVLRPEEVSTLAAIEPREVLLAKIAGAAKAPLANLAGMLASFTRDAAGLFAALLDKREAEPTTPLEPEAAEPVEAGAEAAPVADEVEESQSETAEDTKSEATEPEATEAIDAQAADEREEDDETVEASVEEPTDEAEEE
jgi:large subunit ribosomal protein L10